MGNIAADALQVRAAIGGVLANVFGTRNEMACS
jgi:hypothetical protein